MDEKLISLGTEMGRVVLKSGRVMLPIALESVSSSSECDEFDVKSPEKLFEVLVGESDFCSSYHLPKEDIIVIAVL